MDEENSKQQAPQKDDPPRPLPESTDKVNQSAPEDRSSYPNRKQSQHHIWGLSRHQIVNVTLGFLAILIPVLFGLWQWRVNTIHVRQKERARVVISDFRKNPETPHSFVLTFKNVGETIALSTNGIWLGGECGYPSLEACMEWCLSTLRKTMGEGYGPLERDREHVVNIYFTVKTGKARKQQRPIYHCGYFAYTDIFCVWRKEFYLLTYDPLAEKVGLSSLSEENKEAEIQDCHS